MNALTNSLDNVYLDKKTTNELWKYKIEDVGDKNLFIGRFLNYKMVDSKTMVSQVQELQVILHEIHVEGMILRETFHVATTIENLPLTWKNFKNFFKHKRKKMSTEYLIIRLHIKEDNREFEKKRAHNLGEAKAKANFVEHDQSSKFKKANNKGKGNKLGPKEGKKHKFQEKCLNFGKQGHKSSDCRLPKRKNPRKPL